VTFEGFVEVTGKYPDLLTIFTGRGENNIGYF
jgi:hypothetical protein